MGAMPTDMEDELIAQRDAAIAVTKELQRQLQQHRDVVERTIERRALNAERLRFHAEEQLRYTQDEREYEAQMCSRLLYMSLFFGMMGAIAGWISGLLVFLIFGQPLVGFLMILPGMAFGSIAGFVIAKTRIQLESRQRESKKRRTSRHAEVDRAVTSSLENPDEALPHLGDVSNGLFDATAIAGSESAAMTSETEANASASTGSQSWLAFGWNLAGQTLRTSQELASGLYHSTDYVRGAVRSEDENASKKRR
ncbi:hypothetical protein Poli38472_012396 [Pythium oligandrum]|uniref:Uncharacterized protein n=1 Tax=Pythium oligandrum TaxID=41045 RepID=A0A8K1CR97_PYTOL|nr:hypothetical protein Poli38472_012396 [Pythium oligandrum]|eukprot:TMW67280.1 hypothetical protein Poli38472_012396 [Pythium oligandrum]